MYFRIDSLVAAGVALLSFSASLWCYNTINSQSSPQAYSISLPTTPGNYFYRFGGALNCSGTAELTVTHESISAQGTLYAQDEDKAIFPVALYLDLVKNSLGQIKDFSTELISKLLSVKLSGDGLDPISVSLSIEVGESYKRRAFNIGGPFRLQSLTGKSSTVGNEKQSLYALWVVKILRSLAKSTQISNPKEEAFECASENLRPVQLAKFIRKIESITQSDQGAH